MLVDVEDYELFCYVEIFMNVITYYLEFKVWLTLERKLLLFVNKNMK